MKLFFNLFVTLAMFYMLVGLSSQARLVGSTNNGRSVEKRKSGPGKSFQSD